MSKKHTVKKTAALLMGLALTVGATGCNFILTDGQADLEQVVARVNISETLKTEAKYEPLAGDFAKIIKNGGLNTEIYKRDLYAYFLSSGYNYVQQGYSYKDTFNMLMDQLVARQVLSQYAVAYSLLKNEKNGKMDRTDDGMVTSADVKDYVDYKTEKAATEDEKELYEAHPEVLTMKYFLTDNETDMEEYNRTVYSLQKSLNTSLDSLEKEFIIADDEEEHTHEESRTLPTNANAENVDYYPVKAEGTLDYNVYTGRNTLDSCGVYEAIDGSTTATRKKAYNSFLANLQGYNLISNKENTADVTMLDYYYVELSSVLGQALVNKYYEELQEEAKAKLTPEKAADLYTKNLGEEKLAYEENFLGFESKIGALSDNSLALYGKEGYGLVYSILIPFSDQQKMAYDTAKNNGLTETKLYDVRKQLLTEVTAKDLRDSWICTEEHTAYQYEATGDYYKNEKTAKNDINYLFFEGNMTDSGKNGKYEKIRQFAGAYPYNGKVVLEDGEYKCTPNELYIRDFILEMENYIRYYSGATVTTLSDATSLNEATSNVYNDSTVPYKNADDTVNYEKFIYYEGKVNLNITDNNKKAYASNYFYEGSKETNDYNQGYAVVSAINDLLFAYSTDPGSLNTYMGYVVEPDKTSFVSEYEYASWKAVENGIGSYVVCANDFGWHIVYCGFIYSEGEVYNFNTGDVEKEGTFSNLYYEYLKSSLAQNFTNEEYSRIINTYQEESSKLYKSKYKDLLELDQ